MKLEVSLIAPAEWKLSAETVALNVPAQSQAKAAVEVGVPRDWAAPAARFAIAADVVRDGKYIGQITEAVVEMRGTLGA